MGERGVSDEDVFDTLINPTGVSRDPSGNLMYKKILGQGKGKCLLLAVINPHTDPAKVITVIKTSKISKYL